MDIRMIAEMLGITLEQAEQTDALQALQPTHEQVVFVQFLLCRLALQDEAERKWGCLFSKAEEPTELERLANLLDTQINMCRSNDKSTVKGEGPTETEAMNAALAKVSRDRDLTLDSIHLKKPGFLRKTYLCSLTCSPYTAKTMLHTARRLIHEGSNEISKRTFLLLEQLGSGDCDPEVQFQLGECYFNGVRRKKDLKKSFDWYLKAAERGHADAQYQVSIIYMMGEGVEKNSREGLSWLRKAVDNQKRSARADFAFGQLPLDIDLTMVRRSAELGYAPAQFRIGLAYLTGEGVTQDAEKAARWFEKALRQAEKDAHQGDVSAKILIGEACKKGVFVKKDITKAFAWYMSAAEQGNAGAQFEVAQAYVTGEGVDRDWEKAAHWYEEAAKQGDKNAQSKLGECYKYGWGVPKNEAKAAYWYEEAAKRGDKFAQENIGFMYELGEGVEKDRKKAFDWYLKSANQGVARAQLEVARAYDYGEVVAQDKVEAARWYEKAALQGHKVAQYNLGRFYRNGFGVEKDLQKAFEWYLKSAEQGDDDAQFEVAQAYDQGEGVAQNKTEAARWYEEAAFYDEERPYLFTYSKQRIMVSQYKLGNYYRDGTGVEKDLKKAFDWYLKSANLGYANAQIWIAQAYETGEGTEHDAVRAKSWYQKAAENGNLNAQKIIKQKQLQAAKDLVRNAAQAQLRLSKETDDPLPLLSKFQSEKSADNLYAEAIEAERSNNYPLSIAYYRLAAQKALAALKDDNAIRFLKQKSSGHIELKDIRENVDKLVENNRTSSLSNTAYAAVGAGAREWVKQTGLEICEMVGEQAVITEFGQADSSQTWKALYEAQKIGWNLYQAAENVRIVGNFLTHADVIQNKKRLQELGIESRLDAAEKFPSLFEECLTQFEDDYAYLDSNDNKTIQTINEEIQELQRQLQWE